jgi:sugar transport protein
LTANIANGMISVLVTFVGIWLLGRASRRPMLIAGQMGTTSALLLIGVFSLLLPEGTGRAFVILGLTVTFLAFQQGAISPVTCLMLSEIFPLNLRGFGFGLCALFAVGLLFPILVEAIHISPARSSSSSCSASPRSRSSPSTCRRPAAARWKRWRRNCARSTPEKWLPDGPSWPRRPRVCRC